MLLERSSAPRGAAVKKNNGNQRNLCVAYGYIAYVRVPFYFEKVFIIHKEIENILQ